MTAVDWPFPAPRDDGAAAHIVPGLRFPSLSLAATDGLSIDMSKVAGLSVLTVYPWTGRSGVENPAGWDDIAGAHGSTPQLEGFRDRFEAFAASGARLFGLSRQASAYQGELVDRLKLPFPILSDAGGGLSKALALPTFTAGGAGGAGDADASEASGAAGQDVYLSRMVLIAKDGVIADVIYPIHPPPDCARQTLERIDFVR